MHRPHLEIKASFLLASFLLLIHAGAFMVLLWLDIPLFWVFCGGTFCVLSLLLILCRDVFRILPWAITQCCCQENNNWFLTDRRGKVFQGNLRGDSVVTRYGVLLNFNVVSKRLMVPVVVCSDALDQNSFRQLRVYLLMGGH